MKNLSIVIILIVLSGFFFQNCARTSGFEVASTNDNSTLSRLEQSDPDEENDDEETASPSPCLAGSVQWVVGSNTCVANYVAMDHGPQSQLIRDQSGSTTGQASVVCNNGEVTISASESKSCVTQATTRDCAAGSIEWSVGSSRCLANYSAMTHSPQSRTVSDQSAPTTGQATVACTDGTVDFVPATTKTCVTAQTQPTISARFTKSTYYIGEDMNFILRTGGTVSDDVYVCLSNSLYGCQNYSDYTRATKPTSPTSPTQELNWAPDTDFFSRPRSHFVFDRWYFKAAKKLSNGSYESLGSDQAYLKIKNDNVIGLHTYTRAPGENKFELSCGNNQHAPPTSGFSSYYGNAEAEIQCYYKVSTN